MRKEYQDNPVVRHSVELALIVIKFVKRLEDDKKYTIAKQILRSGTSVGASIIEAQSAESRADFIHKLKIADKEAHETWYWLYLCQQSDDYFYDPAVRDKLDEVMRLLNAIIKNTKQ